jgi:hypothetical protein
MAINKVIFGDEVLMDLTADTIKADKLLKGYTAHSASGEVIIGTCTFDADTQDATATADEILFGEAAYNKGNKLTGTMPNNGAVQGEITTKAGQYTVPKGYHDGSGKVGISSTEQAKIIATNIREGVTILGVSGSMSGTEGAKAQVKTVTPTVNGFEVLPDDGYNYLSQVTVAKIPYNESTNSAGGKTVTIA